LAQAVLAHASLVEADNRPGVVNYLRSGAPRGCVDFNDDSYRSWWSAQDASARERPQGHPHARPASVPQIRRGRRPRERARDPDLRGARRPWLVPGAVRGRQQQTAAHPGAAAGGGGAWPQEAQRGDRALGLEACDLCGGAARQAAAARHLVSGQLATATSRGPAAQGKSGSSAGPGRRTIGCPRGRLRRDPGAPPLLQRALQVPEAQDGLPDGGLLPSLPPVPLAPPRQNALACRGARAATAAAARRHPPEAGHVADGSGSSASALTAGRLPGGAGVRARAARSGKPRGA